MAQIPNYRMSICEICVIVVSNYPCFIRVYLC